MTPAQILALRFAIKRLIEGARMSDEAKYVLVQKVDFERLNRLAAEPPQ